MCGRFVSTSTPQQLADYFSVDELAAGATETGRPDENFNVSPTQSVIVVTERAAEPADKGAKQRSRSDEERAEQARRVLDRYRWGLIPSWAKDPKIGNRMINARAETVAEKPAYKKAFATRRCLIPAAGFYEWKKGKDGKTKQPYFIHPTDEPVFAFAGLWDRWRDPETDEWVRSCTIITGDANDVVRPIHDRMPVVLAREHWDSWLDADNTDIEELGKLLVPAPEGAVASYPVSTRVNSPRNNAAENLDPEPNPAV